MDRVLTASKTTLWLSEHFPTELILHVIIKVSSHISLQSSTNRTTPPNVSLKRHYCGTFFQGSNLRSQEYILPQPKHHRFHPAYQSVRKGFPQIQATSSAHVTTSSNSGKLPTNSKTEPNFSLVMCPSENMMRAISPLIRKTNTDVYERPQWQSVGSTQLIVHYRPVRSNICPT